MRLTVGVHVMDTLNERLQALGVDWKVVDNHPLVTKTVNVPLPQNQPKIDAKLSCGPANYRPSPTAHSSIQYTMPSSWDLKFGTNEDLVFKVALANYAECRFELSNTGSQILDGLELLLETSENMDFYPDADVARGFRKDSYRMHNGQHEMPLVPRIAISKSKDDKPLEQPTDIADGKSLKNDGIPKHFPFCLCNIPGNLSAFSLKYTLRSERGSSEKAIEPISGSIRFSVSYNLGPWASSQ